MVCASVARGPPHIRAAPSSGAVGSSADVVSRLRVVRRSSFGTDFSPQVISPAPTGPATIASGQCPGIEERAKCESLTAAPTGRPGRGHTCELTLETSHYLEGAPLGLTALLRVRTRGCAPLATTVCPLGAPPAMNRPHSAIQFDCSPQ